MKKEVVNAIKTALEELLGLEVQLLEPDWDKPVSFPACWIEISSEESREGVQQPYMREMTLTAYVASRTVKEKVDEAMSELLDSVEQIDGWSQGTLTVLDRTVRLRYKGARMLARRSEQDFIVLIAGVQFSAIYDGR